MTLPAGSNSGRGRGFGKACAPRVRDLPDEPDTGRATPAPRRRLAPVSRRKIQDGRAVAGKPSLRQSRGGRAAARDTDLAGAWRQAVLEQWFPGLTDESDDVVPCPVSGIDLRAGWHAHHWIERDVLWSHGLAARVVEVADRSSGLLVAAPVMYHPFIGVPLAEQAHMRHTAGALPIARELVPARTWDLARVLDDLDPLAGPEWATQRLLHDYQPQEMSR